MAVTAPGNEREGATARSDDVGIDAWILCAEFVEQIVSDAQAEVQMEHPGQPLVEVDRGAIWQAGNGAPSDEAAIGRIIRAASKIARSIVAEGPPPLPEHDRDLQVDGAASRTLVGAPMAVAAIAADPLLLDRPEPPAVDAGEAPMGHVTTARHSGWFHAFTWIRNIGIIMLLFVVWQLWGTAIAQHQAQDQLKTEFDASVRAHHGSKAAESKPTLIAASAHVAPAAEGSVVAELQIPAIGVQEYVVEGTSATDLSKGPGHYSGSAIPGQAGNVAVAGHRTTHGAPFNGLAHLGSGNRIILTTTFGQTYTYVVSGPPQVVAPNDVAVLSYFGDNRITLTTCNPEFSSTQRLVVVGMLDQPAGTVAVAHAHVRYHLVNSATAIWNWSLLPAVGLEVCLLLLLAMSYRLFVVWFKRAKWLILVPLWIAGLYLLFDTLTRFLPSSL